VLVHPLQPLATPMISSHQKCNDLSSILGTDDRYLTDTDEETNKADSYHYPVFGVACTEVEIDCLTGDHTVRLLFCDCQTYTFYRTASRQGLPQWRH